MVRTAEGTVELAVGRRAARAAGVTAGALVDRRVSRRADRAPECVILGGMPYPDKLLAEDEEVVRHLHPHWLTLFWPVVWFLLIVGAASFGMAAIPAGRQQGVFRMVHPGASRCVAAARRRPGAAAALADDPLRHHHPPAAVPRGHPVPPRPRHRPVPDHRRLLPADAVGADHQLGHADHRVGRRERRDGAQADPRQRRRAAAAQPHDRGGRRPAGPGERRLRRRRTTPTGTAPTVAPAAPGPRRRRGTGPSRRVRTGSVGRATYLPPMRLLHTSDWHIGRSLHGTDLLAEQEAVLGGLADVVAAEQVDVVLVAGDVYDRAVPSADATGGARAGWWRGCAGAGAAVVLTPGNHDSARRLGAFSELLAAGGLHVRAETPRARRAGPARRRARRRRDLRAALPRAGGRPPRAGPARARAATQAVLAAAMDRVRADLFLRPGTRSVVLAHAFVGGGAAERQRARHLRRRRRPRARRRCSTASTTSRSATCTGRRRSRRGMRYSGSPLAYSFCEAGQQKLVWLVELDAAGLAEVAGRAAAGAASAERAHRHARPSCSPTRRTPCAEEHFVSARLTDAVRPADPMRQLQARFPHCVHLEWTGSAGAGRRRAATRSGCAAAATSTWPGSSSQPRARRAGHRRASASCWPARSARPTGPRPAGEAAHAGADRVRPVRRHRARSTSTRSAATGCSCCGARPARARRRCSTRSSSRSTARCPASAARRSGCAATTPPPTCAPRSAAS